MADITNVITRVPGVNTATNYVRQDAHVFDFTNLAAVGEVGTHDVIKLPRGAALQALRVFALDGAMSSGAATLQFKLSVAGTAAAINSSAIALSGLAKGMSHNIVASGIKSFDADSEAVIQITVGTAAFTGGKILVIAETIPAIDFVTAG
jgi:hypothetical protein